MRREIKSAVNFLANLVRSNIGDNNVDNKTLEQLALQLRQVLSSHYKHHWHPETPNKGSGYRCVRINHKLDPLILRAGQDLGMTDDQMCYLFPKELTLWIDPGEVSYRIGEDGTVCVLYESKKKQQQVQEELKQRLANAKAYSSPIHSPPRSPPNGSPARGSPVSQYKYHSSYQQQQQQQHHYQQQQQQYQHHGSSNCRQDVRNGNMPVQQNIKQLAAYIAS